MRRRQIAGLAAACWWPRTWAAQPAAGYDPGRPLYIEGPVVFLLWAEPQPHLELLHRIGTAVPADLAQRPVPRQKDALDTAALLARAALPLSREDRRWQVNLPGMARLSAWNVPRPRIDEVIAVVGFPGPPATGTPTLRPEILFMGGRAYPMRADPA